MTDPEAVVLRPGDGRSIELGPFQMSVKASGGQTGGTFSLLEATEPPGFGPPMHIHHDAAEAFYVLAGEYTIFIREVDFRCPAGSFVYIPAEVPHGFRVGDMPSRKLNLFTPAAMVEYFDELSAALGQAEVDPEGLAELAMRHRMEVIGPVPEGYL